jgi:hypothetical protein
MNSLGDTHAFPARIQGPQALELLRRYRRNDRKTYSFTKLDEQGATLSLEYGGNPTGRSIRLDADGTWSIEVLVNMEPK